LRRVQLDVSPDELASCHTSDIILQCLP
jgi:hypothetical protein